MRIVFLPQRPQASRTTGKFAAYICIHQDNQHGDFVPTGAYVNLKWTCAQISLLQNKKDFLKNGRCKSMLAKVYWDLFIIFPINWQNHFVFVCSLSLWNRSSTCYGFYGFSCHSTATLSTVMTLICANLPHLFRNLVEKWFCEK